MSQMEPQISVKVLDEVMPLSDFTLDDVPELLYDYKTGGILDPLGQLFDWLWDLIDEGLAWVVNTLKPFINTVKKWIYDGITGFISGVQAILEDAIKGVRGVVDGIVTNVGNIWTFLQSVYGYLQEMWAGLSSLVSGVITEVTSFFDAIWTGFLDLGTAVEAWINEGIKGFQGLWTNVQAFFTDAYNKLVASVNTQVQAITGFINPLLNIQNWLTNIGANIVKAVSDALSSLKDLLSKLIEWALGIPKTIWTSLTEAASWFTKLMVPTEGPASPAFAQDMILLLQNVPLALAKWGAAISDTIGGGFFTLFQASLAPMAERMEDETKSVIEELYTVGETGTWKIIPRVASTFLPTLYGVKALSGLVQAVGRAFGDVEIQIGIPGTNVKFPFRPGWFTIEMGKVMWEAPKAMLQGMAYGLSYWYFKPMAKAMNAMARNWLPIELPTLTMMAEITRRHLPHDALPALRKNMLKTMALYGYSDDVIDWCTDWFVHPDERPTISITDRFGKSRILPIGLLYNLPSGSDLSRMMIHDIIIKMDDFAKAMAMRGYNTDTALLYYLLHYRYPTLDKLWDFYSRAKAGMLWVDKTYVTADESEMISKYGIGHTPVTPVSLMKTPEKILETIAEYAKWWDYSFFSWSKGFTSDRGVTMELMADIPTRIDARWMYKWGIINDVNLKLITVAKGMHPAWVEPITIGEAMNVLTEERTSARTGVMSTFKEGFSTESLITKTLSKLTTVKILGKNIDVRYLPTEVRLLTVRAKYDRAMDVLRDYSRDLIRAYADNIMLWPTLISDLKASTKQVASKLKIKLAFDKSYYDLYQPVADVLHGISTTRRVRSWIRYMMWRILARLSAGYITTAEFTDFLNSLKDMGKLTDAELDLLKEVGSFMLGYATRQSKVSAILKKLSKGLITHKEALAGLLEQGIEEDTAEAMIEDRAKTYVLSISSLLAYADLVEVPEELLTKKIELLGVPEDEVPIILEVFRIKPIKTEVAKVIRSTLDDFGDGYLLEKDARARLKTLGKKDVEINLLIEAALMEKDAKKKKLLVDAIISRLKRGVITVEEAVTKLKKYIIDPDLVDAIIEKHAKTYTLSISTLLSYADLVPIPEDLLIQKINSLGIPDDEVPIILEVFRIRPIRTEIASVIRRVLDDFEDGYLLEDKAREKLGTLGKKKVEIDLLIEASKMEKDAKKKKLMVDAVINKLKRGAITLQQCRTELVKYIVDPDLAEALIEKYAKIYTVSIAKLAEMAEYIPISEELLKKKMDMIGIPEDEQVLYKPYVWVREFKSELEAYRKEWEKDYVEGTITKAEYKKVMDDIATIWGTVKDMFGIDWVLYSPDERKFLLLIADKKRARKLAG